MRLAEGLETKELREALTELCQWGSGVGNGDCWEDNHKGKDDSKHSPGCRIARNALSRPKSSYENEAVLMEKVVSTWKNAWGTRRVIQPATVIFYAGDLFALTGAIKELDEFREKKGR